MLDKIFFGKSTQKQILYPLVVTRHTSSKFSYVPHRSDLRVPEVQRASAAGLQAPASALRAVTQVLASLTQSKPRPSGRGWAGRAT